MSRAISVLRRGKQIVVPALSAERGSVLGRAVQHRILRALNANDRTGHESTAGRVCTHTG